MGSESDPLTGASVVLITGCSSGLGRALALELHTRANRTYRVVATARRLDALSELAAAGVSCLALDVTSDASVRGAVDSVLHEHGRIDVLINNAGLSRIGPIAEQSLSEVRLVQEVLDANVMGPLRVTQAVLPSMATRRCGLIVMVGSVTSQMTTPWSGAYAASKSALLSLTDALHLEAAPFGVGVTYVMAGAIRSSISDNINSASDFAAYERPGSAYQPWVESIRGRANASQDPATVMPAREVAAQVAKVVDQAVEGRPPPNWFFAGGNARVYWLLGVVQKTLGWPVNGMLSRKYGLTGSRACDAQ